MTEKQLLQHIKDFYCDTTRTQKQTLHALENVRDEINDLINTLSQEMGQ